MSIVTPAQGTRQPQRMSTYVGANDTGSSAFASADDDTKILFTGSGIRKSR